jgi:hypothetical protein
MKFTVREGFVVSYIDRIKQGDKTVEREFAYYPEDGTIDLDKDRAAEHAHKLEPADKSAQTFLESLHTPTAPAVVAGLDVAAIIAAAVQAGMAAALAAAAPQKAEAGK